MALTTASEMHPVNVETGNAVAPLDPEVSTLRTLDDIKAEVGILIAIFEKCVVNKVLQVDVLLEHRGKIFEIINKFHTAYQDFSKQTHKGSAETQVLAAIIHNLDFFLPSSFDYLVDRVKHGSHIKRMISDSLVGARMTSGFGVIDATPAGIAGKKDRLSHTMQSLNRLEQAIQHTQSRASEFDQPLLQSITNAIRDLQDLISDTNHSSAQTEKMM